MAPIMIENDYKYYVTLHKLITKEIGNVFISENLFVKHFLN